MVFKIAPQGCLVVFCNFGFSWSVCVTDEMELVILSNNPAFIVQVAASATRMADVEALVQRIVKLRGIAAKLQAVTEVSTSFSEIQ